MDAWNADTFDAFDAFDASDMRLSLAEFGVKLKERKLTNENA